ncbi:MAG: hypothetical protein QN178_06465 [Armatimonadota bacterium]|nr:hypothetical protein [Armatimonadota bacterium]
MGIGVARGQPITIAYWLVISGPDASLGTDTKRGVELAVADKGGRAAGLSAERLRQSEMVRKAYLGIH